MTPGERRRLSQRLTALADASVYESLRYDSPADESCPVVGITGAPGTGKSTLIARLARARLAGRSSLAIIAIDPSSALSGGAILGDRIRMVDLADESRVYIRSLAARASRDGLANNLPLMLDQVARAGFAEVLLETTGVGQVEYAVRWMVDTMVLVLTPGAGDEIQAMKSGIVEMPDVFVVNKSDLPGARQLVTQVEAVLARRRPASTQWTPCVLTTRTDDEDGFERLSEAIDAHRRSLTEGERQRRMHARRMQVVVSLMARRVDEILGGLRPDQIEMPCADLFAEVARTIVADFEHEGADPSMQSKGG